MTTNNKGISAEIWDPFIGSNVLSIAFWKAESTVPFSFISYFTLDVFIFLLAWLCPTSLLIIMLMLLHQHDYIPSLYLVIILIIICHPHLLHRQCLLSCALFMCSLIDPISTFPFISLLALKAFLCIYSGLLPLLYLNLDLHQSMCWSSFCLLPSPPLL